MNKLSIILSLLLVVSLVIAAFGCAVEEPITEPEQEGPEPTKPVVVVPEELPEKTVLKHIDNEYVPPEAKGVEGAAGKEVWAFHAEEKGKSTISMEYRRPWKKGVEPAKTFTLTVIVK